MVQSLGFGRIFGQRGRISRLADRLATVLGRTVLDKTGLDGNYDITLTFTPDADMAQQLAPGQPAPDIPGPSIFTALQEQLGLKLQAAKGSVEVIVIDAAEKPPGISGEHASQHLSVPLFRAWLTGLG